MYWIFYLKKSYVEIGFSFGWLRSRQTGLTFSSCVCLWTNRFLKLTNASWHPGWLQPNGFWCASVRLLRTGLVFWISKRSCPGWLYPSDRDCIFPTISNALDVDVLPRFTSADVSPSQLSWILLVWRWSILGNFSRCWSFDLTIIFSEIRGEKAYKVMHIFDTTAHEFRAGNRVRTANTKDNAVWPPDNIFLFSKTNCIYLTIELRIDSLKSKTRFLAKKLQLLFFPKIKRVLNSNFQYGVPTLWATKTKCACLWFIEMRRKHTNTNICPHAQWQQYLKFKWRYLHFALLAKMIISYSETIKCSPSRLYIPKKHFSLDIFGTATNFQYTFSVITVVRHESWLLWPMTWFRERDVFNQSAFYAYIVC